MKKKHIDVSNLEKEAEKQASKMYDFEVLLDDTKDLDESYRDWETDRKSVV